MEKEVYTWAEVVKSTLDMTLQLASKTDDELEKALYSEVAERYVKYSSAISLARIATALYKLADLSDEITNENVVEDLIDEW